MKDNAKNFIENFMHGLPEETLKSIGWTDPDSVEIYGKELKEANTTALLKLYGHLNFKDNSLDNAFNRLLNAVEQEFERKHILLKNKHHDNLKQIVYEVFTEMIMNDMGVEEDVECCKFIVIIRQYVEQLKTLPDHGNQYFFVINETYLLNRFNLNQKKMLLAVGMPKTSYYRTKKQAISALTKLIWK